MSEKKSARIINFLNLDFESFNRDLDEFSKIYHPDFASDTSVASSGKTMKEQAAFIGDILSFYIEDRARQTNNITATDPKSIVRNARSKGYQFSGPSAARGLVDFYLVVPATTGANGEYKPDMAYAMNFKNVRLLNKNGVPFEALDDVNFTKVNITSSLETRLFESTPGGLPNKYVLKRTVEVMAGKTVTEEFTLGDYEPYRRIKLSNKNVLDVISVTDSNGDEWFEVNYHAQEAIFEGIENVESDKIHTPYLLKIKTVPRRFVKETDPETGATTLVFGSGKATEIGTPFVPDPSDIALDLKGKLTFSPPSIDPQNFLKTRTMGLAPYNLNLTVKVRVGGGRITNTAEGGLKDIISKENEFNGTGLDSTKLNDMLQSFQANNPKRIVGGREAETLDEVKKNADAFFAAQNRLTNREDYIARSLSMPAKFGRIFRVFAVAKPDKNAGVQLSVLAKNELDQLIAPTDNLKKNLKNYLSLFTRLNQGIDILDGTIINIAIEYSILTKPGFNKTTVKTNTLKKLKDYFNVNKWQIGQPIILDEIRCMIANTDGVISITELNILNRNNTFNGSSYSTKTFDVKSNTRNGIIFAPPDSIFECKFPNSSDIKVSAI